MITLTAPESREAVGLLKRLVRIPSVNTAIAAEPKDRRGEHRLYVFLQKYLTGLGFTVRFQRDRIGLCNLVATWKTGRPGPVLMLEAHADTQGAAGMTVPPFKAMTRKHLLYGRGACDTKGGMAAYITALRWLRMHRAPLRGTLIFAATAAEETGCWGAKSLAASGLQADAAIVAEPTECRLITTHKGAFWIKITTKGRSAHGSCPEKGVNAIALMMRILNRINRELLGELRRQHHPLLSCPTLNVGRIEGGRQVNVVPDRCELMLDWRALPGARAELLIRRLRALGRSAGLKPAQFSVELSRCILPLDCPPDAPIVMSLRRSLAARGLPADPAGVTYGTNAAAYMAAGIPSLVFGPGSIAQAHAPDEHVDLRQVPLCAAVVAEAAADFLKPAQ